MSLPETAQVTEPSTIQNPQRQSLVSELQRELSSNSEVIAFGRNILVPNLSKRSSAMQPVQYQYKAYERDTRAGFLAVNSQFVAVARSTIENNITRIEEAKDDVTSLRDARFELELPRAERELKAFAHLALNKKLGNILKVRAGYIRDVFAVMPNKLFNTDVSGVLDETLDSFPHLEMITEILFATIPPEQRPKRGEDYKQLLQLFVGANERLHPHIFLNTKRPQKFLGAYLLSMALKEPEKLSGIIETAQKEKALNKDIDFNKVLPALQEAALSIGIDLALEDPEYAQGVTMSSRNHTWALEFVKKQDAALSRLELQQAQYRALQQMLPEAAGITLENRFAQLTYLYIFLGYPLPKTPEDVQSLLDNFIVINRALINDSGYNFVVLRSAILTNQKLQSPDMQYSGAVAHKIEESVLESAPPIAHVALGIMLGTYRINSENPHVQAFNRFAREASSMNINENTLLQFGLEMAELVKIGAKTIEYTDSPEKAQIPLQQNQRMLALHSDGTLNVIYGDARQGETVLQASDKAPGTKFLIFTSSNKSID